MGAGREALAFYLKGRAKALCLHTIEHQVYAAAVGAGNAYTNSMELASTSTERFGDILYNIESSSRSKNINTAEDAKALWERVTGKTWPTKETTSTEESDKDS